VNIRISLRENLGYYELQQHKPWSDEECLKTIRQRKQYNCKQEVKFSDNLPGGKYRNLNLKISHQVKYLCSLLRNATSF
jgi:hypothetical protein